MILFAVLLATIYPKGTPVAPRPEQVCAQHRSNYFADLDVARVAMLKAAAKDYDWADLRKAKASLDQSLLEAERYRSCWKQGQPEYYDNQDHD